MSKHVRDEKVLEPYMYLGQILGKNVRGVLIDCFQEWILIPQEKMEIIKVTGIVPCYLFHLVRRIVYIMSVYRTSLHSNYFLPCGTFSNCSNMQRPPLFFNHYLVYKFRLVVIDAHSSVILQSYSNQANAFLILGHHLHLELLEI
jgi:hypothetical protein